MTLVLGSAGPTNALLKEDEQAAIVRMQAGDWDDYGLLVSRYKKVAWAAVDSVLDEKDLVADAVQEVFIRVYEKLHTFQFRSSFSSWLYSIARNTALNIRRKHSARPRHISLDEGNPARPMSAASSTPLETYEAGALEQGIHGMLARLPQEYRVILSMFYLKEYSYVDIAEVLDIPLNTVRTRLRRGRERLLHMSQEAGWK